MITIRMLWLAPVVVLAGYAQTDSVITREGSYWVQTTSGSIDTGGARGLRVVAHGDITVQGTDTPRISYSVRKRVKAASEAAARRSLSGFKITEGSKQGWIILTLMRPANRAEAELTLQVPRSLNKTAVNTQGGDIEASGLYGELEAVSQGGHIHADQIMDGISATTGGGEIRLGSVYGSIRCLSAGGGIRIERAGGESWLETAGGEIVVGEAAAPVHASTGGGNIYVDRAAASVFAETAGGLIQVREAAGEVIAETASGSIQIGAARGVKCASANGSIRLRRVSGTLRAYTALGNIVAELLAGAELENSLLKTALGDVTVIVPSDLAVTVNARNQPTGRAARIVSDFPEIRLREGRIPAYGPVLAEGALNGGGPVLKISAVGGTIYIRRQ